MLANMSPYPTGMKLILLLLFTGCVFADSNLIYKHVAEDGKLNFTQLVVKYGQKCEEHTVVTEDGYLLKLFNIPGDKNKTIFLMHGLVDSADTFVRRGYTSLAIFLAQQGWNVWCGNQRGTKYSRKHKTLDPEKDKKKFWDFSIQELAVYDLPAMIDYVLEATGQEQLHAVGHSQGTMMFYAFGAEKPEYNKKIKLFISLAPVCYLHHLKSLAKVLVDVAPLLATVLPLIGQHELFPKGFLNFKTLLCSQPGIGYELCAKGIFFNAAGSDPEEFEPDFFKVVIGTYPDTSSVKNGNHLSQIAHRKKFAKYNYGILKNRKLYGSSSPPEYDLKNVTMPIALIAAKNDYLSTLEDVAILRKQLPNVVKYHVMERDQFNHIDHVWGQHMSDYLFPLVLDLLKSYP